MKYEYDEWIFAVDRNHWSDGDAKLLEIKLSVMGNQGWQLLEMQPISIGWLLIFMRPK